MGWYIAKIVFQINNGQNSKSQFDEHIRLIEAANFDEAFLKARMLGLQEEASFLNDQDKLVKWEFVNVSEILPVRELCDGQELYSQIHEADDAAPYVNYIHQKAVTLQLKYRPVF